MRPALPVLPVMPALALLPLVACGPRVSMISPINGDVIEGEWVDEVGGKVVAAVPIELEVRDYAQVVVHEAADVTRVWHWPEDEPMELVIEAPAGVHTFYFWMDADGENDGTFSRTVTIAAPGDVEWAD